MYTALCPNEPELTMPGFLTRWGAANYASRMRSNQRARGSRAAWGVVTDEEYADRLGSDHEL